MVVLSNVYGMNGSIDKMVSNEVVGIDLDICVGSSLGAKPSAILTVSQGSNMLVGDLI